MKMWTVQIRDQTTCFVQSDLDLHCPQKLLVSTSVKKELKPQAAKCTGKFQSVPKMTIIMLRQMTIEGV